MHDDHLGALVTELASQFEAASSWENFVATFRGNSYLADGLDHINHPAAKLLREWCDHRVPIHSSTLPWTLEQKDASICQGCHQSANDHTDFIREKMADFIDIRFCVVLPYHLVRHLENLWCSPSAIKDELFHKPCFIGDHSWPFKWGSVNETTLPCAPPEAMQFGGTLP
jgi:predicted CXXCH cytochrome family protein